MDTYDTFAGPAAGFAEQVFAYALLADSAGKTLAMLCNAAADRGVVLRWNRHELPCFTVWKNTAAVEDGYVAGLEPGTNYPNFRSFERQQDRVTFLAPGGRWQAVLALEVHDAAAGVAGALKEIATLQAQAPAIIHRAPRRGFAPA